MEFDNKLSQEITESIEDQAKYGEECAPFMDTEVKLAQNMNQLVYFIKSKTESKLTWRLDMSCLRSRIKVIFGYLSFILKTFNGDPMSWQSFYDSFNEAVHKDESLSNIEKINYLVGYLSGEAETTVKGLQLKIENYAVALDLLNLLRK